jgi:hypothetical protein
MSIPITGVSLSEIALRLRTGDRVMTPTAGSSLTNTASKSYALTRPSS